MKSIVRQLAVIVAVALSAASAASAGGVQKIHTYNSAPEDLQVPRVRTYFTATTEDEAQIEAFRRRLIDAGARNVNWFAPNVIVCEMPVSKDAAPVLSAPGFTGRSEFDVSETAGGLLAEVKRAYQIADERRAGYPGASAPVLGDDFRDVVLEVSPERARSIDREIAMALGGAPSAGVRRYTNQNSEILTGSIKLYLVFPESNGVLDGKTETWKAQDGSVNQDYLDARTHAYAALLDWQGQFPGMGISFTLIDQMVECNYEPIHHNMGDDAVWILDTMRHIDPDLISVEDAAAAVHIFNEERRGGYDWIYTAFIGHSRNSVGHKFHNAGYTAYAFLGGPYLVIPYPAGGDPNNIGVNLVFSKIFEHESSHVFWTLDEYPSANSLCPSQSGYLYYANLNANMLGPDGIQRCIEEEYDCIMNNAPREDVGRPFCKWTKGQIGVIDENGNAIPDVFEAAPTIEFATSARETVDASYFKVRLTAISQAVPNRNRAWDEAERNNYAAPLRTGQFSLGGAWLTLKPTDGRWDDITEDVSLEFTSLLPGPTDVKFRVRNGVGMWSKDYAITIYLIGVRYTSLSLRPRERRMGVSWQVLGDAFGAKFDVYRLDPGEAPPDPTTIEIGDPLPGTRVATDVPPLTGGPIGGFTNYQFTDNTVQSGVVYRYYVIGSGEVDVTSGKHPFQTLSKVVRETAMVAIPTGRILSHASPNPFRGETTFSLTVPQGFTGTQSSSPDQGAATRVEVDIYDVLGRRVARLFDGREHRDVVTLKWDGTNARGEPVSSGVYFIQVKAGAQLATEKVMVIR